MDSQYGRERRFVHFKDSFKNINSFTNEAPVNTGSIDLSQISYRLLPLLPDVNVSGDPAFHPLLRDVEMFAVSQTYLKRYFKLKIGYVCSSEKKNQTITETLLTSLSLSQNTTHESRTANFYNTCQQSFV